MSPAAGRSREGISAASASTASRKVLLFFGGDLPERPERLLADARLHGYELVALDSAAAAATVAAGLPWSFFEEWLAPDEVIEAKRRAARWEGEWYEHARADFTINGVCWPEFDREAMYWFWRTCSLAQIFADRAADAGIEKLAYLGGEGRRPALYYEPTDIHAALWRSDATLRAVPYGSGAAPPAPSPIAAAAFRGRGVATRQAARKALSRWRAWRRGRPYLGLSLHAHRLCGKVLAALNPGEIFRMTGHLRQLDMVTEGEVVLVILQGGQEKAEEVGARTGLPVYFADPGGGIDRAARRSFRRGYESLVVAARVRPRWIPLQRLRYHFEAYLNSRWPLLNAELEYWRNLLGAFRPDAVVVSTLEDSESQLPTAAANGLDIPTVAIPHGVGLTRKTVVKAHHVLFNFEIDRTAYLRSGVAPGRLRGCRGLMVAREYNATVPSSPTGRRVRRLLVLTAPTGHPGVLFQSISQASQVQALRTVLAPPPALAPLVSLDVKVHPGYPDREIMTAAALPTPPPLLPPETDLHAALATADLLVALNYSGVALLHAVQAGKPIIHFLTDQSFGRADPYCFADLFYPSGLLVRKVGDFWPAVERFLKEEKVAAALRQKARAFAARLMKEENFGSLAEEAGRILGRNGRRGRDDGGPPRKVLPAEGGV